MNFLSLFHAKGGVGGVADVPEAFDAFAGELAPAFGVGPALAEIDIEIGGVAAPEFQLQGLGLKLLLQFGELAAKQGYLRFKLCGLTVMEKSKGRMLFRRGGGALLMMAARGAGKIGEAEPLARQQLPRLAHGDDGFAFVGRIRERKDLIEMTGKRIVHRSCLHESGDGDKSGRSKRGEKPARLFSLAP